MEKNNCIIDEDIVVGFKNVYQKELVIPEGITEIKAFAFSEYYGLEEVVLPFSLKAIGDYAFRKCTNLKRIIIPRQTERIGQAAFEECPNLMYADLLNTKIKTIEMALFSHCAKLEGVFLPDSIERIEKIAFFDCPNICFYKMPRNIKICESFPESDNLKLFCISDSIIHFSGLKSIKGAKIFTSKRQYETYQTFFPLDAEYVFEINPLEAYGKEYRQHLTKTAESKQEQLLNLQIELIEMEEIPCEIPLKNDTIKVALGKNPKEEICKLSLSIVNEVHEVTKRITIDEKRKYISEKIEFGGLQKDYTEGTLDLFIWDSIEKGVAQIQDFPYHAHKKKTTYWEAEIEFQSKQKVRCKSSNLNHTLCKVLLENLQCIMDDNNYEVISPKKVAPLEFELTPILRLTIEELDLSVRVFNYLKRAEINTVEDLLQKTEKEIKNLKPNTSAGERTFSCPLGEKGLKEICDKLQSLGFALIKDDNDLPF